MNLYKKAKFKHRCIQINRKVEEGAQYEYFCERGLKNGFHLPLAVNVEKYDDLLVKDVENAQYMHGIRTVNRRSMRCTEKVCFIW